jgi:hypothetical protein
LYNAVGLISHPYLTVHTNTPTQLQAFYSDMKEVDRENAVNRILGAFKLNPFEMLDLKFNASDEDVRRQYRKVSLAGEGLREFAVAFVMHPFYLEFVDTACLRA